MSLPTEAKTPWPPAEPAADYASWAAWYSGDGAALRESATPVRRRWWQFFWGRQPKDTSKPASRVVHLPLAADIAQKSADLLFGDAASFLMPEEAEKKTSTGAGATQQRLEKIIEETGLHNALLEAGETCAAMGGVYIRATWDDEVDYPFLTSIQADQAVPEWRWGRIVAVTFWRELEVDGNKVWRHLERHEDGHILHGLYLGTATILGDRKSLEAHPDTEGLDEDVELPEGLPLDVWYAPNRRPNRIKRSSPVGSPDVAGCETLLDALDEAYSGLLRDIRLGKARILTPSQALTRATKDGGRGTGKTFDVDREVFTELDGLQPESGQAFTFSQPSIRSADHLATALDIIEHVVSAAGYSPQTFGLRIEGQAESGTALRFREQATFRTLARKRRYWEDPIEQALRGLLLIDKGNKGTSSLTIDRPRLTWPPEAVSAGDMANTLVMLRNAEAASTEIRVKMLHPTWDEDKVAAEVQRIRDEGELPPAPSPEF